jgi:hypothetical protein
LRWVFAGVQSVVAHRVGISERNPPRVGISVEWLAGSVRNVVCRDMSGSLADELGGGSQQVIVRRGIGDLAEHARWDVDVVRGEKCFERVPAGGSRGSPVNDWGREIQ